MCGVFRRDDRDANKHERLARTGSCSFLADTIPEIS